MVNIFSSLHVVRNMVFMLTLLIPWLNSTICSCHIGIIVLLTNFTDTLHVLQNMCATLFHSTSTMLKTHVMECTHIANAISTSATRLLGWHIYARDEPSIWKPIHPRNFSTTPPTPFSSFQNATCPETLQCQIFRFSEWPLLYAFPPVLRSCINLF